MQTMGNLVSDYIRAVYEPAGTNTSSIPADVPWIACSFKMNASESFVVDRRSALARIVEERNKLIHQLLPLYESSSIEGCERMIKSLDEQHALLLPEYTHTKEMCEAMIDLRDEAILQLKKQRSGTS